VKTLIPTIFAPAFMAALTLFVDSPSAGRAPRLAARVLTEEDVRDFTSDSVTHPFSHSPEAGRFDPSFGNPI